MRKQYWILLLALGIFSSCEKVKDLSDEADVTKFEIVSYTPSDATIGDVSVDEISSNQTSITIKAMPQDGLFPLQLQAKVETNSTTDKILGDYNKGTFEFLQGGDIITFQLIAESGVPHYYNVMLNPMNTGADIINYNVQYNGNNYSSVIVDPWDKTTEFSVPDADFPLTVSLNHITLSPNALLLNYTAGESLTFDERESSHSLKVKSTDGKIRDWTIRHKLPQIENSDFKLWVSGDNNVNQGVMTIAPVPAKGKGWATANNSYVQGTLPIDYKGGKAAQMTTRIQRVSMLDQDLIAAGTLYTGEFQLKLDFRNPRSMTNFGIPLNVRIKAIDFDVQYIAGSQLQQAVEQANGKFRIQNIEGNDVGQAWVEVLHWTGNGNLEYHGKPINGLEVLGRGEILFDGKDKKYHQWNRIHLPVEYTNADKTPTHIAIVFSSSQGGDVFKGAPGSILNVDNVELIYK